MPTSDAFFDDLQLLALMLRFHDANQLHHQDGERLLGELGGSPGVQEQREAFTRMLDIAQEDELIGFELIAPMGMPEPRPEDYTYLPSLRKFRLRTKGLDRARGQRIADPQPAPGEDDGRRIPLRIIENVADAVGGELRAGEARSFLLDAWVPEEHCPADRSEPPVEYVRNALLALAQRGASGRRIIRSIVGRWLDDELEVGPSIPQRAIFIGQLARAGWAVKHSTLVIAPPSKPPRYEMASPTALADRDTVPRDPERVRKVMVVYGRDAHATRGLFDLLRAVGLQPQEWTQLIQATGTGTPYTGQVLDRALEIVQAVVVLFTPDDIVQLDPALRRADDTSEDEPHGQPRPNVLLEAGLAFGRHPDQTILVELGEMRGLSDLSGRHTVRLGNGVPALHDLVQRLRTAGCEVDTGGTDWLDPNRFAARSPRGLDGAEEPRGNSLLSDPLRRLVGEILEATLGRSAAADVTTELTRRIRNLAGVTDSSSLFDGLPGRPLNTEQIRSVSYELLANQVLDRNPDGRGFVRAGREVT